MDLPKEDRVNLSVFVRVRPFVGDDAQWREGGPSGAEPDAVEVFGGRQVRLRAEKETREFDGVFGPDVGQVTVFERVARPGLAQVSAGYHFTIFLYGQTGSGKTYTAGTCDALMPNAGAASAAAVVPIVTSVPQCLGVGERTGIVPRCICAVFDGIAADAAHDYKVTVEWVQIYQETVLDLLAGYGTPQPAGATAAAALPSAASSAPCQIRECPDNGVFLVGAHSVALSDPLEFREISLLADKSRVTALTRMNAKSSRSHSCLLVTVSKRRKMTVTDHLNLKRGGASAAAAPRHITKGRLCVVDLAGSERLKKSGSEGKRLEEARAINSSLAALGNVLQALVEKNTKHVPYRDSKLTRLLQESLGGTGVSSFIVTLSPVAAHLFETRNTLVFAERAKQVRNLPKVHRVFDANARFAELQVAYDDRVASLETQNRLLKQELSAAKASTTLAYKRRWGAGDDDSSSSGDDDRPQTLKARLQEVYVLVSHKERAIDALREENLKLSATLADRAAAQRDREAEMLAAAAARRRETDAVRCAARAAALLAEEEQRARLGLERAAAAVYASVAALAAHSLGAAQKMLALRGGGRAEERAEEELRQRQAAARHRSLEEEVARVRRELLAAERLRGSLLEEVATLTQADEASRRAMEASAACEAEYAARLKRAKAHAAALQAEGAAAEARAAELAKRCSAAEEALMRTETDAARAQADAAMLREAAAQRGVVEAAAASAAEEAAEGVCAELQQEVEQLEFRNAELEAEIDSLSAQCSATMQASSHELAAVMGERDSLRQEAEELLSHAAQLSTERDAAASALQTTTEECDGLRSDVRKLTEKAEGLTVEQETAAAALKSAEEERDGLRDDAASRVTQLTADRDATAAEHSRTVERCELLAAKVSEVEAERDAMTAECVRVRSALGDNAEEREGLRRDVDTFMDLAAQLTTERDEVAATLLAAAEERDGLRLDVDTFMEKAEHLATERETAVAALKTAEEERDGLRDRVAQVTADCDATAAEHSRAVERCELLTTKASEVEAERDAVAAECAQVRSDLAATAEACATLRRDVERISEQASQLTTTQGTLEAAQDACSKLRGDVAQVTADRDATAAEHSRAVERCELLAAKVSEVEAERDTLAAECVEVRERADSLRHDVAELAAQASQLAADRVTAEEGSASLAERLAALEEEHAAREAGLHTTVAAAQASARSEAEESVAALAELRRLLEACEERVAEREEQLRCRMADTRGDAARLAEMAAELQACAARDEETQDALRTLQASARAQLAAFQESEAALRTTEDLLQASAASVRQAREEVAAARSAELSASEAAARMQYERDALALSLDAACTCAADVQQMHSAMQHEGRELESVHAVAIARTQDELEGAQRSLREMSTAVEEQTHKLSEAAALLATCEEAKTAALHREEVQTAALAATRAELDECRLAEGRTAARLQDTEEEGRRGVERLTMQVAFLATERDGAVSELQTASEECSRLRTHVGSLSAQVSSLAADRDSGAAEDARVVALLSAQVSELKMERDAGAAQCVQLRERGDTTADERDGLRHDVAALSAQAAQLTAAQVAAVAELKHMHTALKKSEDECDSLRREIACLTAHTSEVEAERDAVAAECVEMRSDLAATAEACATLRRDVERISEQASQLTTTQGTLEAAQDACSKLRGDVAQVTADRDVTAAEHSRAVERCELLAAKVSEVEAERDTLAAECVEVRERADSLRHDVAERAAQASQLAADRVKAEEGSASLAERLAALEEEHAAREAGLHTTVAAAQASARSEAEESVAALAELRRSLEACEERVAEREEQLRCRMADADTSAASVRQAREEVAAARSAELSASEAAARMQYERDALALSLDAACTCAADVQQMHSAMQHEGRELESVHAVAIARTQDELEGAQRSLREMSTAVEEQTHKLSEAAALLATCEEAKTAALHREEVQTAALAATRAELDECRLAEGRTAARLQDTEEEGRRGVERLTMQVAFLATERDGAVSELQTASEECSRLRTHVGSLSAQVSSLAAERADAACAAVVCAESDRRLRTVMKETQARAAYTETAAASAAAVFRRIAAEKGATAAAEKTRLQTEVALLTDSVAKMTANRAAIKLGMTRTTALLREKDESIARLSADVDELRRPVAAAHKEVQADPPVATASCAQTDAPAAVLLSTSAVSIAAPRSSTADAATQSAAAPAGSSTGMQTDAEAAPSARTDASTATDLVEEKVEAKRGAAELRSPRTPAPVSLSPELRDAIQADAAACVVSVQYPTRAQPRAEPAAARTSPAAVSVSVAGGARASALKKRSASASASASTPARTSERALRNEVELLKQQLSAERRTRPAAQTSLRGCSAGAGKRCRKCKELLRRCDDLEQKEQQAVMLWEVADARRKGVQRCVEGMLGSFAETLDVSSLAASSIRSHGGFVDDCSDDSFDYADVAGFSGSSRRSEHVSSASASTSLSSLAGTSLATEARRSVSFRRQTEVHTPTPTATRQQLVFAEAAAAGASSSQRHQPQRSQSASSPRTGASSWGLSASASASPSPTTAAERAELRRGTPGSPLVFTSPRKPRASGDRFAAVDPAVLMP